MNLLSELKRELRNYIGMVKSDEFNKSVKKL